VKLDDGYLLLSFLKVAIIQKLKIALIIIDNLYLVPGIFKSIKFDKRKALCFIIAVIMQFYQGKEIML